MQKYRGECLQLPLATRRACTAGVWWTAVPWYSITWTLLFTERDTFFHSAGVQRAQMRQNADGGAGQDPDAQGARVQHAGHPEARQGAAAAALRGQQAAPPIKTHRLQEVLRAR
jgi:hypothetical protein